MQLLQHIGLTVEIDLLKTLNVDGGSIDVEASWVVSVDVWQILRFLVLDQEEWDIDLNFLLFSHVRSPGDLTFSVLNIELCLHLLVPLDDPHKLNL